MFLHGRLDLGHPPPNSNDWAEVEYLHLKDGRTVAGTFLRSNPYHFRELDGKVERITDDRDRQPLEEVLRLVPAVPVGDLPALRRRLRPRRQRRALHRHPRRARADAALLRAAPPGRARRLDAHRGGRLLARRHVRLRHRLLLLVGDRPGLVHRARRRHRADRPVRAGRRSTRAIRSSPACASAPSCSRARTSPPGALFFFYEAWRAYGKKIPVGAKIVAFASSARSCCSAPPASLSTGRASAPSASSATSTSTCAGPIASSATASPTSRSSARNLTCASR